MAFPEGLTSQKGGLSKGVPLYRFVSVFFVTTNQRSSFQCMEGASGSFTIPIHDMATQRGNQASTLNVCLHFTKIKQPQPLNISLGTVNTTMTVHFGSQSDMISVIRVSLSHRGCI